MVVRRARHSERAMPHGYWTQVENVEAELRRGRLLRRLQLGRGVLSKK